MSPENIRRNISSWIVLLAWLIIFHSALCAGESASQAEDLFVESNLSDSSPENAALNQSTYDAHVYVSNKDNERLKVTLFIDSELKDSKELASDSESKIDSYSLPKGPHLFKITWWDEDIKSSCEMEEIKDIQNDTAINLYASNHEAPEKYDILVKLVNENSNDLEVFLYADGSFEKSKEISKDSTSELGTIKLEEGVHNLSVRWQDRNTRIDYEKSKKIIVARDDVLVFYAPQGVSFEAKPSAVLSVETTSARAEKTIASTAKEIENETERKSERESASETSSPTKGIAADDQENDKAPSSTNEAASKSISNSEQRANILADKASYDEKDGSLSGNALQDVDRIYLYAVLVLGAVYLLLRH
ncbi:MAG: hypothetical protein PHQ34_04740 [Methanothrix sp.]|nr:hypothetical protein [Methanothrix sp.]